jgi:16S rRNA (uracil1498-N3)-methyltransferase
MTARLYVDPARLASGSLRVDGADFRYLARVLRLREGDPVTLFDGQGHEAPARIAAIDADAAALELSVDAVAAAARDPRRLPITLLIALLKGEKMDLVVQKATELGVERLVPVAAARSVVHLDAARGAARVARWRKIAREAARQCDRADTPEIASIAGFAEALRLPAEGAFRVIFHEGARAASLRAALPAAPPRAAVVAVGPEGGFDAREIDAAEQAGFAVVGFGPRILRAETAAIAAISVVGYALGDLG